MSPSVFSPVWIFLLYRLIRGTHNILFKLQEKERDGAIIFVRICLQMAI